MGNNGFTLLEMVIVLCIISIFVLLSPIMMNHQSALRWECEKIKDILVMQQRLSQINKTEKVVTIYNTQIQWDNHAYQLSKGVTCKPTQLVLNERGNVTMAQTIECYQSNMKRKIIVTLGKASFYVQ